MGPQGQAGASASASAPRPGRSAATGAGCAWSAPSRSRRGCGSPPSRHVRRRHRPLEAGLPEGGDIGAVPRSCAACSRPGSHKVLAVGHLPHPGGTPREGRAQGEGRCPTDARLADRARPGQGSRPAPQRRPGPRDGRAAPHSVAMLQHVAIEVSPRRPGALGRALAAARLRSGRAARVPRRVHLAGTRRDPDPPAADRVADRPAARPRRRRRPGLRGGLRAGRRGGLRDRAPARTLGRATGEGRPLPAATSSS